MKLFLILGTSNEPVEREMPSLIPIEYFDPGLDVKGVEENMNTETEWNKDIASSMEDNERGVLSSYDYDQGITVCKHNSMNVVYNGAPVLESKNEDMEYEQRSFENEVLSTDDICLAVRTLQTKYIERHGHDFDKLSKSESRNLWNKVKDL